MFVPLPLTWAQRLPPYLRRPWVVKTLWFLWQLAWRSRLRVGRTFDDLEGGLWPAGTFLLALAALFLFRLPKVLGLNPYSAVWILATFAAISITLLALVFAITTFRAQQLATRLPPDLVADLFVPKWHTAALWRLAALLIVSLLGLAPITQNQLSSSAANAVVVDAVLLLWAAVGIARGSRRVFDRSYPLVVARQLVGYLTESYLFEQRSAGSAAMASGVRTLHSDPFALVEQVCEHAMRDGDLTTTHIVLRAVTQRMLDFQKDAPEMTRDLLGWLGELFSVVARKALRTDERTAEFILRLFEWAIEATFEQHRPYDERIELLRSFDELRHAAIRDEKVEVINRAFYLFGRVFPKALSVAPPEDQLSSLYFGEPTQPPHNVDLELEWQHIYDQWISPLYRDMELLARKGLSEPFRTGQHTLGEMQRAVATSSHLGPRQKRFLLRLLLWQSASVVEVALRQGCGEDFVAGSSWLSVYHELDGHDLGDLVPEGLKAWRPVLIEAARRGVLPWVALNEFSAVGRGFAREAQDDRAVFVAETLGALAVPLAALGPGPMQERYYQAADDLRSLAEFDQRTESPLKQAVAAELTKYR